MSLSTFFNHTFCLLLFLPLSLTAQSASWEKTRGTGNEAVTQVLLFSDGYFTWTEYDAQDGAFQFTKGGSFTSDGEAMTVTYEFNLLDSTLVGSTETWRHETDGGALTLTGAEPEPGAWTAIDRGQRTDLTGAWLIGGRMRDGEIRRRDTDRPRKTMKILTGNRFQWIAYNTETGQFFGTGGGAYEAEKGTYTEHIGFFSRDDSKVGLDLSFSYEVKDGDWHHSGKSSTGNPIYEVWIKRKDN